MLDKQFSDSQPLFNMFACASCGVQHADGPMCSVCKKQFDFQCSGVTEAGYRKLGDRKNTWRCPKCKLSLSPSPGVISPKPCQLDKIQDQLNKIALQLEPLQLLVEDVKYIKTELSELKESQEMTQQLLSAVTGKVETLETRVIALEKTANEVPVLQAEIARLNLELENRDQWSRANNIEIRGVPQKNKENLYEIVQKISQLCNISIKKEAINYIARIPTRVTNREKSIVISFHGRYLKEEFLALARKSNQLILSNLGFTSYEKFFINDHLTQRNKTLLSKAKSLAKDKNFKYIWVKHCKIMARKSDSSPIFFIRNENDLLKIV